MANSKTKTDIRQSELNLHIYIWSYNVKYNHSKPTTILLSMFKHFLNLTLFHCSNVGGYISFQSLSFIFFNTMNRRD